MKKEVNQKYNPSSVVLLFVFLLVILLSIITTDLFVSTKNSVFLFPFLVLLVVSIFLTNKFVYLSVLIFFIFFDIRGEWVIPIQSWEVVSLPLFFVAFDRVELRPITKTTAILTLLIIVGIISGALNGSLFNGLKNSFRWFQYLVVLRGVFLLMRNYGLDTHYVLKSISIIVVLSVFLSMLQSLYLKDDWPKILSSDIGSILLGPTEAMSRSLRNNFSYGGTSAGFTRASGLYLSAVNLSIMYALCIMVFFHSIKNIIWKSTMICVAFFGLTLTLGRASFLVLSFTLTFVGVFFRKDVRYLLVPFIGVLSLFIFSPLRHRLLNSSNILLDQAERILIWQTAINAWRSSPVYGIGGGNLSTHFEKFAVSEWVEKQSSAHSAYLSILAENGIVGFLVYCFFLVSLFRLARTSVDISRKYVIYSLVIFIFVFGLNLDLYPGGSPQFCFFLLLIATFYSEQ